MTNGRLNGEVAINGAHESMPRLDAPDGLTDKQLLDRFIESRDQQAFATLVKRHGPMVQGVCQRVLAHAQDAEDAFQATFLVLVRKAPSLRNPDLLGNWLYGVAYRIACKARAQALRREHNERKVVPMPGNPFGELNVRELRAVLDEELQALPHKYRAPLVLCYLEGLTNEEAASRLGWPAGSMSYRIARGRELLRSRLKRRNRQYAMPAGMFALFLQQTADAADISEQLVRVTVKAAVDFAAGNAPETAATLLAAAKPAKALAKAARWSASKLAVTASILLFAILAASAAAYGGVILFDGLWSGPGSAGIDSSGQCTTKPGGMGASPRRGQTIERFFGASDCH